MGPQGPPTPAAADTDQLGKQVSVAAQLVRYLLTHSVCGPQALCVETIWI